MHRISSSLSEMLHSSLLMLNKPTCFVSFLLTHHISVGETEKLNALIICHFITRYNSKEDAVRKMQYILFCNPVFVTLFCLTFLSSLAAILYYLTKHVFMPWVDYWPLSCLLLIYLHTECQSHTQNSFNAAQFFSLCKFLEISEIPGMLRDYNHK